MALSVDDLNRWNAELRAQHGKPAMTKSAKEHSARRGAIQGALTGGAIGFLGAPQHQFQPHLGHWTTQPSLGHALFGAGVGAAIGGVAGALRRRHQLARQNKKTSPFDAQLNKVAFMIIPLPGTHPRSHDPEEWARWRKSRKRGAIIGGVAGATAGALGGLSHGGKGRIGKALAAGTLAGGKGRIGKALVAGTLAGGFGALNGHFAGGVANAVARQFRRKKNAE